MSLAVANQTTQTGTGVTFITTPSISTTSGNLAVMDVSYNVLGYGSVANISDTVGLVWAESLPPMDFACGTVEVYAQITTGNGSHTFTYTSSLGADYPAMAVKEISGALTAGVLAETNTGTDTSVTSHTISLTTSAQADCILCGCGGEAMAGGETVTPTGTFTNNANLGTPSVTFALLSGYKIISATGSNSMTWTTGNSSSWQYGIAAFKALAAVASPRLPMTARQAVNRGATF